MSNDLYKNFLKQVQHVYNNDSKFKESLSNSYFIKNNFLTNVNFSNRFPSGIPQSYQNKIIVTAIVKSLNTDVDDLNIARCVEIAMELPPDNKKIEDIVKTTNRMLDLFRIQRGEITDILKCHPSVLSKDILLKKNKLIHKIKNYESQRIVNHKLHAHNFPTSKLLSELFKQAIKESLIDKEKTSKFFANQSLAIKYQTGISIINNTNFLDSRGCLFHVLRQLMNVEKFDELLLFLLKREEAEKVKNPSTEIVFFDNNSILISVSQLLRSINSMIERKMLISSDDDEIFSIIKVSDSDNTHFILLSHSQGKIYDPYFFLINEMVKRKDLVVDYVFTFDNRFKKMI